MDNEVSTMSTPAALWKGMRPRQWAKNLLVLGAVFFNIPGMTPELVLQGFTVFAAFCLGGASMYLLNDIMDRERDRLHPEKKFRPIASGDLSVGTATVFSIIFGLSSLALAFFISKSIGIIISVYIGQNIAYNAYIKNVVIIEAFFVSFGYLLRILAGAVVVDVELSFWVMMCTFMATLFVTFAKRRHELTLLEGIATEHRSALAKYDPYFLDQIIAVTTASTVVTYSLWTRSPETVEKFGTSALQYTIPFVFYGIFRYLYIVHREGKGGDPTRIFLTDMHLIATLFLWAVSVVYILFYHN